MRGASYYLDFLKSNNKCALELDLKFGIFGFLGISIFVELSRVRRVSSSDFPCFDLLGFAWFDIQAFEGFESITTSILVFKPGFK